jgi:acyl dehydratase
MMLQQGQSYSEEFTFSQADVIKFAEVSGDFNPIHLDAAYAATTQFKNPIIHGFLGGSIFSRLLGTKFPGEGTIYLSQSMEFKRPMYPGVSYTAQLTVTEVNSVRHTAVIETVVKDSESGKLVITGQASVMNKEKI